MFHVVYAKEKLVEHPEGDIKKYQEAYKSGLSLIKKIVKI